VGAPRRRAPYGPCSIAYCEGGSRRTSCFLGGAFSICKSRSSCNGLLRELAPGVAPPHVQFQRRVRDKRGGFEGGMDCGSGEQEVATSALCECGSGAPRRRALRGPCLCSKIPQANVRAPLLCISLPPLWFYKKKKPRHKSQLQLATAPSPQEALLSFK
jgi:hypothetical protein